MRRCPARFRKLLATAFAIACAPLGMLAQEAIDQNVSPTGIDPSKPSNLYSSLEVSGEWQRATGDVNTWGTRIAGSYAPSERHLLQVEVPILYSAASKSMGIGDVRARYFGLVKKDDTKKVNAFGGSLDVFFPTGSLNDGLGSGSWIVGPGIIAGITLSPRLLIYPIASYVHVTKPDVAGAKALNGGSVEVLSVFDLGSAAWIQFSPKYSLNDFTDSGNDNLNFRFTLGKMIREDVSIAGEAFWEVRNKTGLQNSVQLSLGKYFN